MLASRSEQGRNVRHERDGDAEEEQGGGRYHEGQRGSESTATSEEAAEPGDDGKEQGDEVGDPAEAPQVKKFGGCGIATVAAIEDGGYVGRFLFPGPAEGRGGPGTPTAGVLVVAVVEVGPSRHIAGAGNACRFGFEEIGFVQGCGVFDARKDDEHQKNN